MNEIDERNIIGREQPECSREEDILALIAERDRLRAEIEDIENATKGAMDETCGTEKHCACVPLLRVKIKRLEASNAELLEACRDLQECGIPCSLFGPDTKKDGVSLGKRIISAIANATKEQKQ